MVCKNGHLNDDGAKFCGTCGIPLEQSEPLKPPKSLKKRWPVVVCTVVAVGICMVRPIYEDTEGSPVLFPSWAFPELRNLPEGKGGGVVIRKHPHEMRCISVSNASELADADTPEILETLKGLCHD